MGRRERKTPNYLNRLILIRDKKSSYIKIYKNYIILKSLIIKIYANKLKKKFMIKFKKINKKNVIKRLTFLNKNVNKYKHFLENITFSLKNLSLKKQNL